MPREWLASADIGPQTNIMDEDAVRQYLVGCRKATDAKMAQEIMDHSWETGEAIEIAKMAHGGAGRLQPCGEPAKAKASVAPPPVKAIAAAIPAGVLAAPILQAPVSVASADDKTFAEEEMIDNVSGGEGDADDTADFVPPAEASDEPAKAEEKAAAETPTEPMPEEPKEEPKPAPVVKKARKHK